MPFRTSLTREAFQLDSRITVTKTRILFTLCSSCIWNSAQPQTAQRAPYLELHCFCSEFVYLPLNYRYQIFFAHLPDSIRHPFDLPRFCRAPLVLLKLSNVVRLTFVLSKLLSVEPHSAFLQQCLARFAYTSRGSWNRPSVKRQALHAKFHFPKNG